MQKLDSVLVYFTGLQDREDIKIGFHPPRVKTGNVAWPFAWPALYRPEQ